MPHFRDLSSSSSPMRASRNQPARFSVDVSKEDKPLSSQPEDSSNSRAPQPAPPDEEVKKLDPRRLEARFAMLNTGIYECRCCGYRYDEAASNPSYPIPPGFQFGSFPTTGGAQHRQFVAGFAQNQQFGLGGNSLTSGQKASLIYGRPLARFSFLHFTSCSETGFVWFYASW